MSLILALALTTQTPTSEVLSRPQAVLINQRGYVCVAQQVLKGSPEAVGKWRVLYPVQQACVSTGCAGLFLSMLNATRSQYGLPAVGYDPNLEGWAAANNGQQAGRGLGHHVMGPARRQNAAMGQSVEQVHSMWMNSSGHRSAMLDPTIRAIGLAQYGQWWTMSAN